MSGPPFWGERLSRESQQLPKTEGGLNQARWTGRPTGAGVMVPLVSGVGEVFRRAQLLLEMDVRRPANLILDVNKHMLILNYMQY